MPISASRRLKPAWSRLLRQSVRSEGRGSRSGYVLLETVVATGLLIVGLAVIGSQVQDAAKAIRQMDQQVRALSLAEQHLVQFDLGLIELESVDEIEEGDFGPRYPDYGWRLITEPTALEAMYLLRVEILYLPREDDYREDDFDHDDAETLLIVHAMRPTPQPIDFARDFGLNEEELTDLDEQFEGLGIEGLDVGALDPALLGRVDMEDLLDILPTVMQAMRMDLSQLTSILPPNILEQLHQSGLLDGAGGEKGGGGEKP